MRLLTLLPYYVHWHYSRALRSIADITYNSAWFLWHFFSIGVLLRTYFTPWQRLHEESQRRFDIEDYLSRFIVNSVMRLTGIFVRTAFIVVGLIGIILIMILGASVLALWFVLPLVVALLLITGIVLIVQPL